MPSCAKSCITSNRSRGCCRSSARHQLAAVHVFQRHHRDLQISQQGVAGGRRERSATHRLHRAAHDEVDFDLDLNRGHDAPATWSPLLLPLVRVFGISLLQPLGSLPNSLVDARQRLATRQRVIGKDQIEIDRQARHVAHEQVDRGCHPSTRTCRPTNTSGATCVSRARSIEIGLVHGLSTKRPTVERDTQGRSLPVGSVAGSSMFTQGSDASRPSCRHSRTVLMFVQCCNSSQQHVGAQAVRAFDEFAGFLQGLTHADFAQQFRKARSGADTFGARCAARTGRRAARRPAAHRTGACGGTRREAFGEPFRQTRRVHPYRCSTGCCDTYWRTPYQSSADLPPTCKPSNLRCNSSRLGCRARVSFGRPEHPAGQAREPTRPDVVDGQVRGDAQAAKSSEDSGVPVPAGCRAHLACLN